MPRKTKKSKEEKIVEEYFPVDESDLKHAVEKQYKKPDLKSREIVIKKSDRVRKKISLSHKKNKIIEYRPPKISLKKNGYELIITEKPQAATKISSALGKAVKKTSKGVSYYEVDRNNSKIVVACAVGHLFTLKEVGYNNKELPIFDIRWIPNFIARKKDFTKRYYDVILQLAKKAGSITIATDYDTEGEVIGLNVLRFICNQKDASRMKFSTLTKEELERAYESKFPSITWSQAIAGETRHYLDWFYGINLSRALMDAVKTTGKFKLLSIGRVQGPALKLIVEREKKIQKFKPESYWQVFIKIKDLKTGKEAELKYTKDIFDKKLLDKFKELEKQKILAKTIKKKQKIPPNPPFNLTALQTEAYRVYGITPSETLRAAQSLYLSGLISYPRTSSQKLPDSIDYKSILKKLAKQFNAEHLIKKGKPVEGKKSDPAHPSIYPTAQENGLILAGNEEKIYNLIVKRFLSLFCEDAIINKKTITAKKDDLKFTGHGGSISKSSWLEIYPTDIKENSIPDINGEAEILSLKIQEKETQPPKRYSPASIISELEKRNLGTKATRSVILETLYERDYIREKSIEATPLGISLIDTLKKYSPIIIDEKLTRDFERELDSILSLKKGFFEKQKTIIDKAKGVITKIIHEFNKHKEKIGRELITANIEYREQQKLENRIMLCPKCKKGYLAINYSKKNKRYFVACDAYPECNNTFTLPPGGLIKKTDKVCEKCGFPLLMRISKGKRPWIFCFNPECPTNKERIESYKKKTFQKEGIV